MGYVIHTRSPRLYCVKRLDKPSYFVYPLQRGGENHFNRLFGNIIVGFFPLFSNSDFSTFFAGVFYFFNRPRLIIRLMSVDTDDAGAW